MEKYICYQDENGKPAFREVTEEELSVLQPEPLTWHKEAKPFRVSIAVDGMKSCRKTSYLLSKNI